MKLCGITRHEDAELAASLDAWAIGFILWPGSKRAADPGGGRRASLARMRRRLELVGVFVNPTLDEVVPRGRGDRAHVRAAARRRGSGVLHRRRRADRPARDQGRARRLRRRHPGAAALPHRPAPARRRRRHGARGGTGQTWDWALAAQRHSHVPLVLSGGLTPENVADGIAAVRPWAVDVASGVESAPGVKDHAKVEAFMAAAREAAVA